MEEDIALEESRRKTLFDSGGNLSSYTDESWPPKHGAAIAPVVEPDQTL
ncbi:hypothetical protein [[Limnothrix rosea] IAM M-220]|nr:hypothetical protein [[Limnothrix rosea] IAM M-220]